MRHFLPQELRVCKGNCKKEKHITQFPFNERGSKSARSHTCKDCTKQAKHGRYRGIPTFVE